jgi:AmmeMemoRadiSam system protein B/AmmeMemoRadiSam system protein A
VKTVIWHSRAVPVPVVSVLGLVVSVLVPVVSVLVLSACVPQPGAPAGHVTPLAEITEQPSTPMPEATPTEQPPIPSPERIRHPQFAGSWYPDDPDELAEMVDGMLAQVEPVDGAPLALVAPHAGYVFSGPVAATSFKQMVGHEYDVAVIIASDHQAPLSQPISVWAQGGFETPLGVVPVDEALASALIETDERITFSPSTYEKEHVIEIELPFLQRVCPDCRIVPVLMGADDEETIGVLTDALVSVLPGRRVVVIASSDLSHYPDQEDARRIDGATLAAVETFDPVEVRDTIAALMGAEFSNLLTCACGEAPILVAMRTAQGLGADTVTILRYANSGDSEFGDTEQVVGYGAVMFWRYRPPELTQAQREELMSLVRITIAEYLETGDIPDYQTDDPVLNRRSGVFVTLKEDGNLRGCIGHTQADTPLYRVVQETAVSAATGDPRFPALTAEEMSEIGVEISILSPLRRITSVEEVEVGTHGLMIVAGGRQGLFLPQVPVEQGWDLEEYLNNLCLKAGLPHRCWNQDPTLYTFTAVVFGEETAGGE